MRLLSLHQPWASLMAEGHKTIETRGRRTSYRGPVAIHASLGITDSDWECAADPEIVRALYSAYGPCRMEEWIEVLRRSLPFGKIIAVGVLIDCCPTDGPRSVFTKFPTRNTTGEQAFGNYDSGRFGWVFQAITRVPTPVLYRGMVGLIPVNPATATEIEAQFSSPSY